MDIDATTPGQRHCQEARSGGLGVAGLADEARSGRPRRCGERFRAELIAKTLGLRQATTHWSTHRLAKEVGRWLAEPRHARFKLHFTPTSAFWMNQVETWFGILTEQVVRRGNDESVRELAARIDRFVREWSRGATPFTWVNTAEEILAKAVRKPQETSGAPH